jgi:proteasome lid subunit RPN8/RPN11
MDAIHLRRSVRADMVAHAREEAPRECCGLLIGEGTFIDESVRIRNVDARPTRYQLDPAEQIATNRRLRGTARRVIGCYHSHPHSPPFPSDTDRAEAYYPEFVWLIVSLSAPVDPAIAAYRFLNDGLVTVPVVTED